MARTLQQIRNDSKDLFRDTGIKPRYTDPQWNGFINAGQSYLATLIEYPVDFTQVTTQLNIGAYTLPGDNLIIVSAYFGDVNTTDDNEPLTVTTEEVLKKLHPHWLDVTTSSTDKPKWLIQLDNSTVFIFPRPNSTYAGKTLILRYIYVPANMSADGDTPDLPVNFHDVLKFYAVYLAYLGAENTDTASVYKSQFIEHVNSIREKVTRQTQETLAFKWGMTLD